MSEHNHKQMQIKADDETLAGDYANAMRLTHTQEEFILDFMTAFPPQGRLNNRVIVSPGHMKRMLRAMQENIQKYEQKHGAISESDEPDTIHGFPVK